MTLTHIMLNGFKDYIIISYHILVFVQQKNTRFTMEQPDMLSILYCQYHSCWCPGDLRSQGISRHGIDEIIQNILSLAPEEFIIKSSSEWLTDSTTRKPLELYHWWQCDEQQLTWIYTLGVTETKHRFSPGRCKYAELNNIWNFLIFFMGNLKYCS